jgi:hypothetical protein
MLLHYLRYFKGHVVVVVVAVKIIAVFPHAILGHRNAIRVAELQVNVLRAHFLYEHTKNVRCKVV